MAACYVQVSGGPGVLYAPVPAVAAADVARPGVLPCLTGLRFLAVEPFDTDVAATAGGLVRAGRSWAGAHAVRAARPSVAFPTGRYLLTTDTDRYDGTGVRAVHPDR